ncbi:MAG: hypothetical protein LBC88_01620 [Spirochaetaceae bacterium]|jgi:hypothetical protein|nr:hypothetical protein [Spirochaetaceae bacterium]
MKITVELPDDISVLFPEAKKLAAEHGVVIDGDTREGSFTIKGFRAAYTVSGRTVTAFAGKVPPFLTEKKIREEIEKYFKGKR